MRIKNLLGVCALAGALSLGAGNAVATTIYWTDFAADSSGSVYSLDSATLASTPVIAGVTRGYRMAADNVAGQVYWTTVNGSGIYGANTDGSAMNLIVAARAPSTQGIDVDYASGKIYYTQGSMLRVADLDGSNDTLLYNAAGTQLQDVKIDAANGRLYLTEWDGTPASHGAIISTALDGSDVQTVLPDIDNGPVSLDLDTTNGMIYWVGYGLDERIGGLHRVAMDGTGSTTILPDIDAESLALDLTEGYAYMVTPSQTLTSGEISRVALDGTGFETISLPAGAIPVGLTIVPEPAAVVLMILGASLMLRRR